MAIEHDTPQGAPKDIARDALFRCLQSMLDPVAGLSTLPSVVEQLNTLGEDLVPALRDLLDDNPLISVYAARILLLILEDSKGWAARRTVKRCEQLLNGALRHGDRETQMWTCMLLQEEAPTCALAALRELEHGSDFELTVLAAAVLVATKACDSNTMAILRTALSGEHEVLAVVSALALARIGTWNKPAVALLVGALESGAPLRPAPILEGLKLVGVAAKGAAKVVAALVDDESLPEAERRAAAIALGSITRGTTEGVDTLEKALFSPSWHIVLGAATGLAASEQVTDAAIARLEVLVRSADANLRRAAYEGLRGFGERAAPAANALAARIGDESDPELLEEAVRALVAIGIAAAPSLVQIVREADMRKAPTATIALTVIASERPADVLRLLLEEPNSRVRATAVQIVAELGEDAAPALPMLSSLLDQAASDEVVSDIIVTIAGCGPVDELVAAAVVRALLCWPDIPIDWANRWLWYMGPHIGSAIANALSTADAAAKRRLEALEASPRSLVSDPLEADDFVMFAGIELAWIEIVVRVAAILGRRGEASWPELLRDLQASHVDDSLVPLDLDINPKTLGNYVKKLGEALKVTFTWGPERGKRRLVQEAAPVLEKARTYLEALRQRRKDGQQAT